MHTLDRNSAHTVRQNVIAPAALLRSASGHPAPAQASSRGVSVIPVLLGICADEDKKLRGTGAFCEMRKAGLPFGRGVLRNSTQHSAFSSQDPAFSTQCQLLSFLAPCQERTCAG